MNKCVTVIVGAKWGDEGKGKIASYESQDASLVIRGTGGANAGHTIVSNGKKLALHLVPGGIVYPHTTCIIGPGVVLDLQILLDEIRLLENSGIPDVRSRLKISGRAHLVFDYHKALDFLHEKIKAHPVGTTGQGIGPCYSNKADRVGLRVYDLLLPISELEAKLKEALVLHNQAFLNNSMTLFDSHEIACTCKQYATELQSMIADVTPIIAKNIINNKKIVVEGAQAFMLDLDHGNYPMVTSSNCCIGGTICGANVPIGAVKNVILVDKAYNSRVGNGPFPTEVSSSFDINNPLEGDTIRELGHEYGTTTNRPRRCGWMDTVILKTELYQSGGDFLCLNHLDTLGKIGNTLGYIKICTKYQVNCENNYTIDLYPDNINTNSQSSSSMVPVYKVIEGGWDIDSSCRNYDELPEKAKEFIELVEKTSGLPVKYIGVGPDNNDLIIRQLPETSEEYLEVSPINEDASVFQAHPRKLPSRHYRGERK